MYLRLKSSDALCVIRNRNSVWLTFLTLSSRGQSTSLTKIWMIVFRFPPSFPWGGGGAYIQTSKGPKGKISHSACWWCFPREERRERESTYALCLHLHDLSAGAARYRGDLIWHGGNPLFPAVGLQWKGQGVTAHPAASCFSSWDECKAKRWGFVFERLSAARRFFVILRVARVKIKMNVCRYSSSQIRRVQNVQYCMQREERKLKKKDPS